ncbi:MAG: hypothetical protein WA652_04185, partial [Xanthobacteraceae bacterium]
MPWSDDFSRYDPDQIRRELMMPAGEPAAALIGGCLLLGFVWFATALSHPGGGAKMPRNAAAAQSLQSGG